MSREGSEKWPRSARSLGTRATSTREHVRYIAGRTISSHVRVAHAGAFVKGQRSRLDAALRWTGELQSQLGQGRAPAAVMQLVTGYSHGSPPKRLGESPTACGRLFLSL